MLGPDNGSDLGINVRWSPIGGSRYTRIVGGTVETFGEALWRPCGGFVAGLLDTCTLWVITLTGKTTGPQAEGVGHGEHGKRITFDWNRRSSHKARA